MPQVDIEAIEAEAKSKASAVVERLRTIEYAPPRISLMNGLIAFLIWAALTGGLVFGYGWYKAHQRDVWWRAQIAAKSAAVRSAIMTANKELPDDAIIKTLGDYDAKLLTAERNLALAPRAGADGCPVIPAQCLRQ